MPACSGSSGHAPDAPDIEALAARCFMRGRRAASSRDWRRLGNARVRAEPRRYRTMRLPRPVGRWRSSPTTGVISCAWRWSAGARSGCAPRIVRCRCCPDSLAHFLAATVHVARQSFDAARTRSRGRHGRAGRAAVAGRTRFSAVGLHWLRGLLHLPTATRTLRTAARARARLERSRTPLCRRVLRQRPLRARCPGLARAVSDASQSSPLRSRVSLASGHLMARAAKPRWRRRAIARRGGCARGASSRRCGSERLHRRGHGRRRRRRDRGDDRRAADRVRRRLPMPAPVDKGGWWLSIRSLPSRRIPTSGRLRSRCFEPGRRSRSRGTRSRPLGLTRLQAPGSDLVT